jgi:Domain of unknown function DUF1829/Domain of unknown function DUF1828
MIDEVQRLLDQYVAWLKDKTVLRSLRDWVEITTPYLDRHNDYLQIYARQDNGNFVLTDDGYTLNDLRLCGCNLDSRRRQELLAMTLAGFGVHLKGDALEVSASRENFALRKHNLVQAMLAVNDMFYLASPVVTSLFYEDVLNWLELHQIRYTPRVKFTGTSGYDHLFDFVIPKSQSKPERLLRAINRPNRDTAEAMVFAWFDTREARAKDSRAYAILNDSERVVPSAALDALRSYDVTAVVWSNRDQAREDLAA